MKTKEETMSIIHHENNHREINTFEEIEILKAASSKYLLNDVIAGQNDPMYELLPSSAFWTPRSTVQTKQKKDIWKPNNWLNSNCQTEETSTPHKTCWKCRVNDERPTEKETTSEWDDGGKIGNKNKWTYIARIVAMSTRNMTRLCSLSSFHIQNISLKKKTYVYSE